MCKKSNNDSGLFFLIKNDNAVISYEHLAKFIEGADSPIVATVSKRLNERLIDYNIAATITLKNDDGSDELYNHAVKLDFKASADKEKYNNVRRIALDDAKSFIEAFARAISMIEAWLDLIEADKFKKRMQEEVLLAGLELEVRTIDGNMIFSLCRESEGDTKIKFFSVETRDPSYQEKLMSVVDAYMARDLMHKLTNEHPEMPIVYRNYSFEVPWMLRVPFAKTQMKELYNRNLEDLDHGIEMALNMGPVPITRRNLEILQSVMDDLSNSLESKFNS